MVKDLPVHRRPLQLNVYLYNAIAFPRGEHYSNTHFIVIDLYSFVLKRALSVSILAHTLGIVGVGIKVVQRFFKFSLRPLQNHSAH